MSQRKLSVGVMPDHTTLPTLVHWQAQTRPLSCALRFEAQTITYADLHTRMQHAAATLWHTWGVRSGDRVAYLGLNHPDQIVLLLACAQIGAICVPMNYRLAAPEWAALLADCTPHCWLCDAQFFDAARAVLHGTATFAASHVSAQRIMPFAAQSITLHSLQDLLQNPVTQAAPELATPNAPALLVYTSGTTGLPKGALHTQQNILANMALAQQIQAQTAIDLIATVLPLFHVGGLCIQTLPALYTGACTIVHARFDAAATLRCIAQERPTLTLQVPATIEQSARGVGGLVGVACASSAGLSCARRARVQRLWQHRNRAVLHCAAC
jgi:fatty-acyl-CoA synthase